MDLYTYIASSNPYQAKALLYKYGYSTEGVRNDEDLGVCLKKLVAYEGQDAFTDILSNHPDIGVILEKFDSEKELQKEANFVNLSGNNNNNNNHSQNSCNCGGCSCNNKNDRYDRYERGGYHNFSGDLEDRASKSTKEVSVFIMAAALMLAAAIIVKK
jgi:hypothetical protein